MRTRPATLHLLASGFALVPGIHALAQTTGLRFNTVPVITEDVVITDEQVLLEEASSSSLSAEEQLRQEEIKRELRILRRQFFGSRNTEVRQIGISQLRQYNDPVYYPALLEIFARDGADVRTAILDMLLDQRTDQADATLAWSAVFEHDAEIAVAASERLRTRIEQLGHTSDRVKLVLLAGLQRKADGPPERAAELARRFRLADLIPHLITAQASPPTENERTGNLANIVIGRQIAYVSDLQPVVADNAVGFDPTLSVVTEGVVLGVHDAVVTVYRPAVHRSLVGLSSDLWGSSTQQFAYDRSKWQRWYTQDFRPFWLAQQEQLHNSNTHSEPAQAGG